MAQSKPKGDRYERKIAKKLSPWVGFNLCRAPQSGGGQTALGDVVPVGDDVLCILPECKNQEGWEFNQIWQTQGSFHLDWIPQLQSEILREKERSGLDKFPMLLFTRNRKADYVAFPQRYTQFFFVLPFPLMHVTSNGEQWTITLLDSFLKNVTYQQLSNIVEDTSIEEEGIPHGTTKEYHGIFNL